MKQSASCLRAVLRLSSILSLLGVVAWAEPNSSISQGQLENQIASQIHQIDQMEIMAGHLAMQKGTTQQVRNLGGRLARDHNLSDQRLLDLAKNYHLDLSLSPPEISASDAAKDSATLKKLQTQKGKEFNKTYLESMVKGHQQAVRLLTQSYEKLTDQSPLKGYIRDILPILEQHEHVAAHLEKKEG